MTTLAPPKKAQQERIRTVKKTKTTKRLARLVGLTYVRVDRRRRDNKVYAKDIQLSWELQGLARLSDSERMVIQESLDERFQGSFSDFLKSEVFKNQMILTFRYSADRPTEILLDAEVEPRYQANLPDLRSTLVEFFPEGVSVARTLKTTPSKAPKKGGGMRVVPKTPAATTAKATPKKSQKASKPKKAAAPPTTAKKPPTSKPKKGSAAMAKTAPKKSQKASKPKKAAASPTMAKKPPTSKPKKVSPPVKAKPKADRPKDPSKKGTETINKVNKVNLTEAPVVATRFEGGKATTSGRVEVIGHYIKTRLHALQNKTRKTNEAMNAIMRAGDPTDAVPQYLNQLQLLEAVQEELRGVLGLAT